MCFELAAEGPAECSAGDEACEGAQVRFAGAPAGALELRTCTNVARTIAANFLGIAEAETTRDDIAAVWRELANIICGATVSQFQSDSGFTLFSPESIGAEEYDGIAVAEVVTALELNNGFVRLRLALDGLPN